MTAKCPHCAAAVALTGDPELGELLDCNECDEELEIVCLDPPELAPAPEEEEDWGE